MRIPLLPLLALGAIGSADLYSQDLTTEQIQALLERQSTGEAAYVLGEVIVKMRDDVTIRAPQLRALGLEATARQLSGREFVYRIPQATLRALEAAGQAYDSTMALVDAIRGRPDVEYAQPNYILHIVDRTPNDPRFSQQWHYFNNGGGAGESPGGISLPRAWDTSTGDTSIVVSIIDTGILPAHPDIVGSPNLLAGFDMISDASRANDGGGRDNDPTDPGDGVSAGECGPGSPALPDSWHGTHVAGTVGVGNTDNGIGVAGINWNVSVQAVRVLGKCGGTIADINDAIRWAAGLSVSGVPDNATPARIINMSLGAGPGLNCSASPSTQAAINDAVNAGTAVVVAAGNSAADANDFLPASCDSVITVAANDARGRLVTRYSNFGATVEIMAPGGDVQRDDDGDGNPDGVLSMVQGGYAYFNGTSMATPHVAGVSALWLASDPSLTPARLLAELQNAALPRNSTQCPQPCGAGLLSAVRTGPQFRITLVLDPDKKLSNGESTIARATVRRGGAPEVGITVSFTSNSTAVTTVAPASVVTNASGVAEATVTGVSRGDADITATANGISASTPVQVPSLSLIAFALLLLALGGIGFLRLRKAAATR